MWLVQGIAAISRAISWIFYHLGVLHAKKISVKTTLLTLPMAVLMQQRILYKFFNVRSAKKVFA
jgi:hypothetical protein